MKVTGQDTDTGAAEVWSDTVEGSGSSTVTSTDTGSEATVSVSVAAGEEHTCAILSDGLVRCWGFGYARTPIIIPGVTGATAVSSGNGGNACAVIEDGSVRCWRSSTGDAAETVTGITEAVAVSLGEEHACTLTEEGAMKCWGHNDFGQLGVGSTTALYDTPVSVAEEGHATALAASDYHTCTILTDGTVKCWGNSCLYGLGDDTRDGSPTPVLVTGLSDRFAVSISAGYCHTCAVVDDGSAQCWGYVFNELPSGRSNGGSTPNPLSGISHAVSVSTAWYHRCAVIADGSVKCSGYNDHGQLGDGTTKATHEAVFVEGLSNAVSVSVGEHHSCAVLKTGEIACWGSNDFGQLGNDALDESPVPVVVLGTSP